MGILDWVLLWNRVANWELLGVEDAHIVAQPVQYAGCFKGCEF